MVAALPPGAKADVAAIVAHYRQVAGVAVARDFNEAFRATLAHIGQNPDGGSQRYGHPTRIDGLRCWPVRGFPYLVFYRPASQGIVVLRVLHGARDIPATLRT